MFGRTLRLVVASAFTWALGCGIVVPLGDTHSSLCSSLCSKVMTNCVGENQVYETQAKCLAVCSLLSPGDPAEPVGTNTVVCRQREAELAASAAAEDVAMHCRSAGPEGLNCGGLCESYCTLYEKACDHTMCGSHDDCVEKCPAFRDRHAFNVVEDHDGNTIQCRLVHLTNASLVPEPHCGHAMFQPTQFCTDVGGPPNAPTDPDCTDYCRSVGIACTGDQAEYETTEQCMNVCARFPAGEFSDTSQNTLGCRLYHAYNALCDAAVHCPHAGPGGEGHCGTNRTDKCASYCTLANGLCQSAYATAFADDDACLAACAALPDASPTEPGDAGYTVSKGRTPGTLACRFLALGRAATNAELCGGAPFGGGECAP